MSRISSWTPSKAAVRYLLLQVPGWVFLVLLFLALRAWQGTPLWIGFLVLLAWVIKDVALFPLVRDAYDPGEQEASRRLIGLRGAVQRRLDPAGSVRLGMELWHATLAPGAAPAEPGALVTVRDVRGMVLVVEPSGDEEKGGATSAL